VKEHKPKIEGAIMASMQMAWGNATLWNAVTNVVFMGRLLGGFDGKITHLPSFLSGWTDVRDTAVPPKKSFRAWFDSDDAQELLRNARNEAAARKEK
jgi:L-lactate dehydrogenase complex protein LldF